VSDQSLPLASPLGRRRLTAPPTTPPNVIPRPLPAPVPHRRLELPARIEAAGFRPDVEGLRAIAVVLVLLYHARLFGVGGGYIGVDVFFVLSGFLITRILIDHSVRETSVKKVFGTFYTRRIRRLLPLAAVVLLSTVWASYRWLGFVRGDKVAGDARWAAGFLANIRFARIGTDYFGAQTAPSPLQHFWSLAVEEQFYFVWPALVFVVIRCSTRRTRTAALATVFSVVALASFAWCVYQTPRNGVWAYYSPFTRAWQLAIGALVALAADRFAQFGRRSMATVGWVALGIMIATAWWFDETTVFPGWAAAAPSVATAAVLLSGSAVPAVGALTARPLQWIGKLSYSLYLWHWPILVVAEGHSTAPLSAWQRGGLLGAALACSLASYHLIENPVRHSSYLSKRVAASIAFGAVLVASTFAYTHRQLGIDRSPTVVSAGAAESSDVTPTDTGALPSEAADPAAPADTPVSQLTSVESLRSAVAASPDIDVLPANLEPPLGASDWANFFAPLSANGCSGEAVKAETGECVYGDPTGSRLVVLFGDSHGVMWIKAMHLVAEEAGWQFRVFAKLGCPVLDLEFYDPEAQAPMDECAEYRRQTVARVNELKPDAVVLTSDTVGKFLAADRPTTAADWQAGLTSTLNELAPGGARLVVLGDVPLLPEPNPDCLAAHTEDVQACGASRADALARPLLDAERAAAASASASYIDVIDWFCAPEWCSPVIGTRQVFTDQYHVTPAHIAFTAGALRDALALTP
jgi:peptidoglycan/LPS O-acetylase OafA/YrhL